MGLLPRSPRRRRRLAWVIAALGLVGVVALLVALLPGATQREETPLRAGAGADTASQAPPLRLTAALRAEVDRVVRTFLATAVTRADPAAAWGLASSSMRAGIDRAEWDRGDLPGVVPYDAASVGEVSWRVVYRTADRVGLDVLVAPKPGSGARGIVYQVDLALEGGRLLVAQWAPEATLGGQAAAGPVTQAETVAAAPSPHTKGRLDARWLLLPLGIVVAALLTVVVLVSRHALQGRRAQRRFARHART